MNLARATAIYDPQDQDRLRTDLEQADEQNLKRGRDIEMGSARIILASPNGLRWAIVVSNTGVVSAVAL